MNQKFSIHQLLFPAGSRLGQKKQQLLSEHRVICPNIEGTQPFFRITWERMQAELVVAKQRTVDDLAACKEGDQLSSEYQSLPIQSALGRFMRETTSQFLPSVLQEYNPAFGFDLDAFLLVDEEANPRVITEIFPRENEGKISDAYTSVLQCEWPMVCLRRSTEDIGNNIPYFVLGEEVTKTTDFDALARKWAMHRGCWYIREERTIGLFLNNVVLSVLEFGAEGQQTIVAPEISIDFSGRRLEGVIHLTTSQRR